MLGVITNTLKRIFGKKSAPAPQPKKKNQSVKSTSEGKRSGNAVKNDKAPRSTKPRRDDGRPRRDDAPRRERFAGSDEPERIRRERKPRMEKPERPRSVETPDEPPRVKPAKPAELADVPVCEGKTRFLDLPIHQDVQFGIQHQKFEYCTPIQAMVLPYALAHRDVAGKAQTGTGKTAAFLVSTFTELLNKPLEQRKNGCPRALVLAPTRELAMQIHKDALELALFTDLNCTVVFGGMDHEKQRRSLGKPIDLLIGTPGRIIDYSRGSSLDLSRVEVLVIDEADRMLDMGFVPDVRRIVAQLPKKGKRQTMLFSATLEESILRLASGWLVDPVTLESEPEKLVSENIEQTFYSVSRDEKLAMTLHIVNNEPFDRMLIFGNRKDVNLRLQDDLKRYGIRVPILSGDIPQDKRIKILEKFRTGEEKIVIATDVAARGIHVDDVSLVLNYDLPERAEDYVHRIGRTGRAGHHGKSISFLCEYGAYNLPAIEELLGTTFNSIPPTDEMLKMPSRPRN